MGELFLLFDLKFMGLLLYMLRSESEKVYIEHCVNCYQHTWCTSHDENKYKDCFSKCKDSILRACSNLNVCENIVPLGLEHNFLTISSISKPGKPHFPRLGSFEVYFRGRCIFSKLDSMRWPPVYEIANKIKQIQDTPERFTKNTSNFPETKIRTKSQKPVKKKLKKALIKPQKIKVPKDMTHEKLENLIKNHRKKRTKRFSDLLNKQKSRSSSGEKESDLEVFVESYPEKNNKESLVKESKDRLQKEELKEFFGEIKNQGQRMAEEAKVKEGEKAEFGGKFKDNENSLFNTSRSSEESGSSGSEDEGHEVEEGYKEKSEENKQEVGKTIISDKQEGQKGGSEQNFNLKKSGLENSFDQGEYEADNYGSESEKPDKIGSKQGSESSKNDDSKIESGEEDQNKNKTSEKDEYEENFEDNSSENSKISPKSNERYSIGNKKSEKLLEASNQSSESKLNKNPSQTKPPKSDSNSENYSDFDKNSSKSKESSESNSRPEKSENKQDTEEEEENYSEENQEDYDKESNSKTEKSEKKQDSKDENYSEENQEEYDQEFEETHPLRPINKSFEINLKVGVESRKKITYENISENDSKFIIKSSNPSLMFLKDEVLQINKGIKEKIQLIFTPIDSECEKKFYLYIEKDNEEWECLEIVVNYTN